MLEIKTERTKLPYNIYIDTKSDNLTKIAHVPCVYVETSSNSLSCVSIANNPKIIDNKVIVHWKKIFDYIVSYKAILMAHYNELITAAETKSLLGSIDETHISNIVLMSILSR